MCLIIFVYLVCRIRVFKFNVCSVIFFGTVVYHLSVTNGSIGKGRNVDHFIVKISLGSVNQDVDHLSVKISMPAMPEQENVDHFSVKILVSQNHLALDQDVDHLSVKILKLRHYTEPLTSPVFIFNVTRTIALKTFFVAKEKISMLWGFSHIFSYQMSIMSIKTTQVNRRNYNFYNCCNQ